MEAMKIVIIALAMLVSASAKEMTVRVTYYYSGEDGSGHKTATGKRLKPWYHVAVDPRIIPYGKRLKIGSLGVFVAEDTGSAVISRKAARNQGRRCPVIDICVRSRREMEKMAAKNPMFMTATIL